MSPQNDPRRRGRSCALALALAGFGAVGGCTEPIIEVVQPVYISPRLLPADVVKNLETAYKRRNSVEYAKLLGSEFQFWFDPGTQSTHELPEYWTRLEDSTGTSRLLAAPQISNVQIDLKYGLDVPDNRIGHDRWRRIEVWDTFLSVDRAPEAGSGQTETTTLIVDGDLQAFYLRKGFTEGDTLPGSPTASEWFLVEWRDLAQPRLSASAGVHSALPRGTKTTTVSGQKGFERGR